MITRKTNFHVIQSIEIRKNTVIEFLRTIRPDLSVRAMEVHTELCHTCEAETQAIIFSAEPGAPGDLINDERKRLGISPLLIEEFDLIMG